MPIFLNNFLIAGRFMKLSLAYFNDPVLRRKADRVNHIDDNLRELVEGMIKMMHALDGIGIAAPQVHRSVSLFVTCVPSEHDDEYLPGKDRVFINPQILSKSKGTQVNSEGCLSLPNIYLNVTRPKTIKIQATDLDGNIFEETMTGYVAANFMHENDHLQGTLIVDHLSLEERKALAQLLSENINR